VCGLEGHRWTRGVELARAPLRPQDRRATARRQGWPWAAPRRRFLRTAEVVEREKLPIDKVRLVRQLNPHVGTEPSTVGPVLLIQTDLLSDAGHPSTWILPCTTRLTGENLLRVVLPRRL
jgi:hypothetical protein